MNTTEFKSKTACALKIIALILLMADIECPVQKHDTTIQAGIQGRHVQKCWNFLKGCVKSEDSARLYAKNLKGNIDDAVLSKPKVLPAHIGSDIEKLFGETVNCVDDILPQISENLSKPVSEQPATEKVIRCVRQDADKTRMLLYENNTLKLNKIIKSGNEVIRLNEYDVHQMEEFSYIGNDGLEWVVFRIPRKAEYLLNRQFEGRLFECMVFNLPKDSSGKWELLKAFIIDFFTRPGQLWDEYLFYSELRKINLNKQEINELHEYMFALLRNTNHEYIPETIRGKAIA